MKKEYKILSSITSGLNETYNNFEDLKRRVNYIEQNKNKFKHNSMLFIYINIYNENNKIIDSKTLKVIDFKEKMKMKKELLENIYEIITENAENIKVENGVNIFYTQNNKIFIEINENGKLFEINIKEVKE